VLWVRLLLPTLALVCEEYEFRLEDRILENHLLRRMNVFVTVALADLHKELEPHYSEIGRPSIDPELMIRMLIVMMSTKPPVTLRWPSNSTLFATPGNFGCRRFQRV
jgi:hypothetical protein